MRLFTKGYILLEVVAASAILVIVALSLSCALISATAITEAARAVTRGRLLARSHLEQAAAGNVPETITDGDLVSVLTVLDWDGTILWQVEVSGGNLHRPLKVVGGP